jgi:hypothetical protein
MRRYPIRRTPAAARPCASSRYSTLVNPRNGDAGRHQDRYVMSFRSVFRHSSTDQSRWSGAGRGDVHPTPYLRKHGELRSASGSHSRATHTSSPALRGFYDRSAGHLITTHIHASRVEITIVRTAPPVAHLPRFLPWRLSDGGPSASRSHRDGAVIRNPVHGPAYLNGLTHLRPLQF